MFVDDRLRATTVSNQTAGDNWMLAIEIQHQQFNGIFGGVYHSPSSSDRDFLDSFENWLQQVMADDKTNVISGDFNICWNNEGYSRDLKNIADAVGLEQKVLEHTRISVRSRTTIDLVFANVEDCTVKVLADWRITDHETLGINVEGVCKINMPEKKTEYTCWRKYSKERLQNTLLCDETLWRNNLPVDEKAQQFSRALATAVGQLTETRMRRSADTKRWFTPHLQAVKLKRDEAYKIFKTTNCAEHWERYKQFRNEYVRELQKAKNSSVQQEIQSCSGDSKKLWRCLKDLIKPGGTPEKEIIFDDKTEPCSDEETANRLNHYFIKSVKEIHDSIPTVNQPQQDPLPTVRTLDISEFSQFQPISMEKLRKIVAAMKNCAGVENISKRVLEDAMDVVGDKLLDIINSSLNLGVFPQEWKKSVVVPIPKVPNSTRAEDRRPINMLPIYEKVLETVVREQLVEYVDRAGLLIEEQSGFRKQHSCESALNLLMLKWKQSIENNKFILTVFVDLKRAFETIDRRKLLEVLRRNRIKGDVWRWFKSYLEYRTQITRYNNSVSEAEAVELGVPQGSVLGPLLFILYINDLTKALRRACVNLFADDTVIYVAGDKLDECYEIMNNELAVFADWLKWKKLKLNVSKTKYMVVTTRRSESNCTISVDGELVERVNAIKYLGVMLDEKLSFAEHVDYTIRKAARKLGVLCRINRYLSLDNKIMVYKTLIAPHFDYCASILFLATNQQRKRMQIVQSKAMRMILRCDRLTPRILMLDSLQWMSIRQRVEYSTLVFIFKVVNGLAPQYLTKTVQCGRDVHRHFTRQAGDIRLLNFKKSCTQNSLFYRGYNLFNMLPESTRATTNLREFKKLCKPFVRQRPLE